MGHQATARCTPEVATTDDERLFCEGWGNVNQSRMLIGLHETKGTPGRRLLDKYGSLSAAAKPLLQIMIKRIAQRPKIFLRESIHNISYFWTESDAWYLPKQDGRWVRDPEVKPLFTTTFSEAPKNSTFPIDNFGWVFEYRISARMFALLWCVALSLIALKRRSIAIFVSKWNIMIVGSIIGIGLVAFGGTRYATPIEVMVMAAVPLALGRAGLTPRIVWRAILARTRYKKPPQTTVPP